MDDVPKWRVYERIVACFEVESASMDVSVTPNAVLVGRKSRVGRQIDILVDARWETGTKRRIIFDAKRRGRKLNVKDVDEFVGLMSDVEAARGVLVCTSGWSDAAKRRADKMIDLRLLTEDEAQEFDHAAMDPCPYCRRDDRKTGGVVFWDGQFPITLTGWAIVFTGKCDGCHSFAYWCWDCGEKVVVPDDVAHTCGCEHSWFVEQEEDEVVFVMRTGEGEIPLDRRPMR